MVDLEYSKPAGTNSCEQKQDKILSHSLLQKSRKNNFFLNKIEMNDKIIRISLAEKRKYCDLIKSGANYSQKSLLFSINKFLLGKKVPYISFFLVAAFAKKVP